jgi:hypothetical protein
MMDKEFDVPNQDRENICHEEIILKKKSNISRKEYAFL